MVFNVENLFDIDGEALFDDYRQEKEPGDIPYSPAMLAGKLSFIADTLAAVDSGRGPDIVLFQELERDRTPGPRIGDPVEFLFKLSDRTLAEMLTPPVDRKTADLPAVAFLLKALAERGIDYPWLAMPPIDIDDDAKAHINVVLSRFPIRETLVLPTTNAREVLVTRLDVDGHPFTVINNHWKSGASRPETETARVANAETVRRALEGIFEKDPSADVVVGGDLNSYYNQILLFPGMGVTGINSVLGSQGDELAVAEGRKDLYNLWFELPIAERYSETWRDMKGTLMHIIVTPGLYDDRGVRYLDGSFERVLLPGRNIDAWGRTLDFTLANGERGGSDHLPLLARFETVDGDGSNIMIPVNPGREEDQPSRVMLVDYDPAHGGPAPKPAEMLEGLDETALRKHLDEFFTVDAEWISWNPPTIRVAGREWEFYSPRDTVWARLGETATGDNVRFLAELGLWDGEFQWVVRDPEWLEVVGRRGLEPRTN